jgi:hypothetical protein
MMKQVIEARRQVEYKDLLAASLRDKQTNK